MNVHILIDGLISFLGLIALLTFHEFGHAWMAWKRGDDTARLQGRLSLNPLVHIDPVGTVIIPLAMIFLSLSGSGLGHFLVGWARPVPVNPSNLRSPRLDDILISLAGPAMNGLLAVALVALARAGVMVHSVEMTMVCLDWAKLSLILCFFNLLPVPPLDGSHVVRSLVGMSYETYWKLSRYGFVILIVVLQIPAVRFFLSFVTEASFVILRSVFSV